MHFYIKRFQRLLLSRAAKPGQTTTKRARDKTAAADIFMSSQYMLCGSSQNNKCILRVFCFNFDEISASWTTTAQHFGMRPHWWEPSLVFPHYPVLREWLRLTANM